MRFLAPHRLALALVFLVGLAFAFWLSVFFHDPKRPSTVEERADRLAAQNYAALSLSAPSPPSPAHWAQRLVSQDAETGARRPVAREASALLLTVAGGSPRAASVLAFALASAALAWALRRGFAASWPVTALLVGAAMLASARAQAWQMTDPTPWLILTGSALALGAWWRHRAQPGGTEARLLGLGLAVLLLSAPALFVITTLAVMVDARLGRKDAPHTRRHSAPALRPLLRQAGLVLLLPCALLLLRNQFVTGNALVTPAAAYKAHHVTAPTWFWQTEGVPQPELDFVIERYDQLVALPAAQIPTPAYRSLLTTYTQGASHAGGAGLVLFAVAAALLLPARLGRPALLLAVGTGGVVFLRFAAPLDWWALALPPCTALCALGLRAAQNQSPALPRRLIVAFVVVQAATLPLGSMDRPRAEEYSFADNLAQTAKRIREVPGQHLVFVRLDDTAPAFPEPADLPRDWAGNDILLARELGREKDAALVAALPAYTTWRIIVFRDRIGLQRWSPLSPEPSPDAAPDTPKADAQTDAEADAAPLDDALTPEPAPPAGRG